MIEAHGGRPSRRYMGFVQDNADAAVRRAVSGSRDGAAARPHGRRRRDRRVTSRWTRRSGEATLDFTRHQRAAGRPTSTRPPAIVDAAALYVFRTLVDDDIPLNAGCLSRCGSSSRRGSMLGPHPPAAVVAGNVETSQHVVDGLYAALGRHGQLARAR